MSDDTTIEGQLKEYLMLEMKARDMCNAKTIPGYKYQSMSEFVLLEGRFMGARSKQSDKYPPGQKNMCYKEALEMAMAHTEPTYCEGIAASIIPVRHAWCIDRDGNVIDTVWQDGEGYYTSAARDSQGSTPSPRPDPSRPGSRTTPRTPSAPP